MFGTTQYDGVFWILALAFHDSTYPACTNKVYLYFCELGQLSGFIKRLSTVVRASIFVPA